jgi:hypothetical protein
MVFTSGSEDMAPAVEMLVPWHLDQPGGRQENCPTVKQDTHGTTNVTLKV